MASTSPNRGLSGTYAARYPFLLSLALYVILMGLCFIAFGLG